jgi:hypothetical protein
MRTTRTKTTVPLVWLFDCFPTKSQSSSSSFGGKDWQSVSGIDIFIDVRRVREGPVTGKEREESISAKEYDILLFLHEE